MICAAADSGSTSSQVFFDRRNRHSWLSQHKGVQQNVKEFKVLGHMHDTIRKERPGHELLNEQDRNLCSNYKHRERDGQKNQIG